MKKGQENVWIVGDIFINRVARDFINMRDQLFTTKNFETRITCDGVTDNFGSSNAVGRILNTVVRSFNTNRNVIPKWVVIAPETDIMNSINYTEFGVSGAYGLLIEYMMKEINNLISKILGHDLPLKANRYNRPHILWVEPTLHQNYPGPEKALRTKFIRSLHTAALNHNRMVVLPIKQNWPTYEAMITTNGSLNIYGYKMYAKAIDSTIRYADTKLMRNFGLDLHQIFQKQKMQQEMAERLKRFERGINESTLLNNSFRLPLPSNRSAANPFNRNDRSRPNTMRQQLQRFPLPRFARCDNQANRRHGEEQRNHPGAQKNGSCRRQLFKKDS